jgi:hypothetical protein
MTCARPTQWPLENPGTLHVEKAFDLLEPGPSLLIPDFLRLAAIAIFPERILSSLVLQRS